MTTTTLDAFVSAIGAALVARSTVPEAAIYYQQEPIQSPYAEDTIYVNQGDTQQKRLLQDLFEVIGNFEITCWVSDDAVNPKANLRTTLNALVAKVLLALNYDESFGDLARASEVYSTITDGGYFAEAGKAVAKVYLRATFYTVN